MANILRSLYFLLALIIIGGVNSAVGSENSSKKITKTTDLALEGERSAQTKRPILLLISRPGCPYCAQIKSDVLEPMIVSGDYKNKIIMRELTLNTSDNIRNFDRTIINTSDVAIKYNIKVTPTLLFLNSKGRELTKRIVGINTVELFSYYVDQAIDQAVLKLHSR